MRRTIILNWEMFPSLLAVPLSVRSHVRGLCSRTRSFASLAHDFNILALTETWLNDSINNSELFDISNYNTYRCPRVVKKVHNLFVVKDINFFFFLDDSYASTAYSENIAVYIQSVPIL
jgi:hypothetical protein